MADLGQKQDSPSAASESPSGKEKSYPSLTLRDDQVDKVKGEHSCEIDEEYDAFIRIRVKGLTSDEYGKSITFDVLQMDEFTPAEGGGEAEEEVEEEAPAEKPAKSGKATKALTYS